LESFRQPRLQLRNGESYFLPLRKVIDSPAAVSLNEPW